MRVDCKKDLTHHLAAFTASQNIQSEEQLEILKKYTDFLQAEKEKRHASKIEGGRFMFGHGKHHQGFGKHGHEFGRRHGFERHGREFGRHHHGHGEHGHGHNKHHHKYGHHGKHEIFWDHLAMQMLGGCDKFKRCDNAHNPSQEDSEMVDGQTVNRCEMRSHHRGPRCGGRCKCFDRSEQDRTNVAALEGDNVTPASPDLASGVQNISIENAPTANE